MPTESDLLAQLNTLGTELERRQRESIRLAGYSEGGCAIPKAVVRARMTNAYRLLMDMSEMPWGSLVVGSKQDRLEVTGITSPQTAVDEQVWGVWQDNGMDAESKLAHAAALTDGRAFATVWRPAPAATPEIVLDDAQRMIVAYQEGSRRRRVAAMRYWTENKVPMATLYRPEAIYKFQGPKHSTGISGVRWERRQEDPEWPLPNPLGAVPVVELAVNRKLKPGQFGYARGEYAHVTGLIDRINLLTFVGLIVALWMGFPLRGVIGEKILRDDDGNQVPPFDADADSLFQLENKDAKLAQYEAADRRLLLPVPELAQLAYLTATPAHYFPLDAGLSNISADAIRALEGAMHAAVANHKGTLGEGWEETLRLSGRLLAQPVELSQRAQLQWRDSESRSLAERADAASKLKDTLPWQAVAEIALNASQDDINRWQAQRAGDGLSQLVAAAAQTARQPLPAAA